MSEVDIVEQYTLIRPQYEIFTERTRTLIDELLKIQGIKLILLKVALKQLIVSEKKSDVQKSHMQIH